MTQAYSRTQIILHWAVVVLLAAQYLNGETIGDAFESIAHTGASSVGLLAGLHVYGGFAVLVLALVRLGLRLMIGAPQPPEEEPDILKRIASWTHRGIYALLVLIPLIGMGAWFGGIEAAGELHEALGSLLLALIGLHVTGAFFHQFILGTDVLARMRPRG